MPASGLSNLRVAIPETIARGSDVTFNCSFNLQDETLYAIKWYRGTYEIFRYIPSEDPPVKTFPLEGFNISVSTTWNLCIYSVKGQRCVVGRELGLVVLTLFCVL